MQPAGWERKSTTGHARGTVTVTPNAVTLLTEPEPGTVPETAAFAAPPNDASTANAITKTIGHLCFTSRGPPRLTAAGRRYRLGRASAGQGLHPKTPRSDQPLGLRAS